MTCVLFVIYRGNHIIIPRIKMTIMEYVGCGFIAFGLPAALFIVTIARDPLRVLVLMARYVFIPDLLGSIYGSSARSVDPKLAQGSIDRAARSMDFACDTNHCIIIGASNIYIDRLVIQVH